MSMSPEDFKRNQEQARLLFIKFKKRQQGQQTQPGNPGGLAPMDAPQASDMQLQASGAESSGMQIQVPGTQGSGIQLQAPESQNLSMQALALPTPAAVAQSASNGLAVPAPALAMSAQGLAAASNGLSVPTVFTPNPAELSIVASAEHKRKSEKRGIKRKHGVANENSNKPVPNKFTFTADKFPFYVKLPVDLSIKEGKATRKLTAEEIVVYFDDLIMPIEIIIDDKVVICVNQNPFEKLYRPKDYDNVSIPIFVYNRKKCIRKNDCNLQHAELGLIPTSAIKRPTSLEELRTGRIYREQFKFFMSKEASLNSDQNEDSDDDNDRAGCRALKTFALADIFQLAMIAKAQEALFTLIQAYLRGAFLDGNQSDAAYIQERSRRNMTFTRTMELRDIKAAREWFAATLIDVAKYYDLHFNKDPNFINGIMQLLDFSHGLGSVGAAPFQFILNMEHSPFGVRTKILNFRFQRHIGESIAIVRVFVHPSNEMREIREPSVQENAAQYTEMQKEQSFMADFEKAFANLKISAEDAQTAAAGVITPDVEMSEAPGKSQKMQGNPSEEPEQMPDTDGDKSARNRKRARVRI